MTYRCNIAALVCLTLFLTIDALAEEQPSKEIYDSQKVDQPRVPAAEVAAKARLPEGFRLQVAASEPDIQQPIAMSWDSRGRLWVVENYTYAETAIKYDTALRDRILIFEDTDHDGTLDSRKVFWDQGKKVSSIEIGFGGVWVMAPPALLFIPDNDHDDQPDSPPEVLLDGFDEMVVHHNMANGLRWGPDGWLYGRHGIQSVSNVGLVGSSDLERRKLSCSIWRFHPQKKIFDVVCQGTTNPWGMDWDQYGNLFFINTVIGHLWHALPGAHLQRMYGEDLDPTVYELMPQIADHMHFDSGKEEWSAIRNGNVSNRTDTLGGGHAHSGMMIYQGNQWPAEYRNKLFTINFHGRRLNVERLEQAGAGFVGSHESDMIFFDDPWFRGVDLSQAPDGSVFLIDWSDTGECHENDGVHRHSGTIYRIAYDNKSDPLTSDLRNEPDEVLVKHVLSDNSWYARQARLLLAERSQAKTIESKTVESLLNTVHFSDIAMNRLSALWCLASCNKVNQKTFQLALNDQEDQIKIAAIQILVAPTRVTDKSITPLLNLMKSRPSDFIALHMTSALQKIRYTDENSDEWKQIVSLLMERTNLANDRDFPLMLWYAIKDHLEEGVFDIASSYYPTTLDPKLKDITNQQPTVRSGDPAPFSKINRFAIRKLASQLEQSPTILDPLLHQAVFNVPFQQDIILGMDEALKGRRKMTPPLSWAAFVKDVKASNDEATASALGRLQVIFGNGIPMEELAKIALDPAFTVDARRGALRSMTETSYEEAVPIARKLVWERLYSSESVNTLVRLGDAADIQKLIARFDGKNSLPSDGKQALVQGLCNRRELIATLLTAVETNAIPRQAIGADLRRQMQLMDDPLITARIVRIWPDSGLLGHDKAKQILALEAQLSANDLASANLQQGRLHWNKICASCHKLFGEGGLIGPEITGAQRSNLRYLTENIVDPSVTVATNYRVSLLMLEDDQIVSGVILNEDASTVTVQTTKERMVIEKDEIAQRKPSNQSLMPEGLLDNLDLAAKRDLFAYLQSNKQVSIPKD